MPCGGIYSVPPSSHNQCFMCEEGGGDLFCEEWDTHLHRECLGAFLRSEEGKIVLAHGHAISVDAVNDLDGDDLLPVSDGLSTLVDGLKELTPLVGPLDELLLTLNTSVKQLQPPWHDRESYQTFATQVEQLGTLLMWINSLENDKLDIQQWRDAVIAAGDQIGTVRNACP